MTIVLSSTQRAALVFLAERQADEPLRRQIAGLEAVGGTATMATLRLRDGSPRSSIPDGPAPVIIPVIDDSGDVAGELILWVLDGFADLVEQTWYGDEPPTRLPDRDQVRTYAESEL